MWAHLSQPGTFPGWWLFQGIAKPCHSAPSVSQGLAPPGEKRGEGTARGHPHPPPALGWGGLVKYQPHLTDGENKLGEGKRCNRGDKNGSGARVEHELSLDYDAAASAELPRILPSSQT